jgi:hypothetical protein
MDQFPTSDKETISRAAGNHPVAARLTDSCALVPDFPGSFNFAATAETSFGFGPRMPNGARRVSSLQQM